MEDEVYEVEKKVEKPGVVFEYYHPAFWKRVSIIVFDALIWALICLGLFIGCRAIVQNTQTYKDNVALLDERKGESGIFLYDAEQKRYVDIVSFYNSSDVASSVERIGLKKGIETFFTYIGSVTDDTTEQKIRDEYDTFRLSVKTDNLNYFVKNDSDEIVENLTANFTIKQFNENVYKYYVDNYAQGYFLQKTPNVLEINKYFSNMLFFVECPIALIVSYSLYYLAVPLILKRGKLTLGRLLFKTGLVDSRVLSVSWKRYLVRFCIMFCGEIVLSIFTFGIPLIISFTMMAFTKKKQNFHDYMLGIEEVDYSESRIFLSLEEASGESIKKAPDFRQK